MANGVSKRPVPWHKRLVPWCGRIQAGSVDVARKKSFILEKGKGITCSTKRERFHTSRGKGFISGWFYTTLNLEEGRDYIHYLAPVSLEPGDGLGRDSCIHLH
jgi:hypothetical protein